MAGGIYANVLAAGVDGQGVEVAGVGGDGGLVEEEGPGVEALGNGAAGEEAGIFTQGKNGAIAVGEKTDKEKVAAIAREAAAALPGGLFPVGKKLVEILGIGADGPDGAEGMRRRDPFEAQFPAVGRPGKVLLGTFQIEKLAEVEGVAGDLEDSVVGGEGDLRAIGSVNGVGGHDVAEATRAATDGWHEPKRE